MEIQKVGVESGGSKSESMGQAIDRFKKSRTIGE